MCQELKAKMFMEKPLERPVTNLALTYFQEALTKLQM